MSYPKGMFEADLLGLHSDGFFSFTGDAHHSQAGTITIPDAHLLFSGDFERSGNDLIITDREHRVVVEDYFRGEKRPALVSPEGAPLDSKVVEALSGHTAYAQAGSAPSAKLVGHVVKMTGSASIVRNGTTIALNNGDNVYQNDLVQTGSGSTLGLVLSDGTTFNITANARLMLNELVYDANSASNTALFTMVQGAASFVAGQVAKTGDMKVGTPVATMGIRGTAVILEISSTDGKVSISVVDQQDGQVHSVQVFNTRGDLIGTVTSNGASMTLTPIANFEVIAQQSNKTPVQVAQEFNAFQQVLSTYDIGKQQVPSLPPPSDGRRGDVNQQSTTKFASSTPIAPSDTPVTTLGQVGANTKNPAEVVIEDAIAGTSTSSTSSNQPKSAGTTGNIGASSNQANTIDTSVAPDILLSHSSVAENTSAGTPVGIFSAIDHGLGETAVFVLTGNAAGLFALDGNKLVVAGALDFESAASHQITVQATDAGGSSFNKTFTISIGDVVGLNLTGDAGNNALVGTPEADRISGLEGNDRLRGLAGNDRLDGGLGFDRAVYTDATGSIAVNLAAGTVTGSGVGTDTLIGIEAAVGSDFADTFNAAGFAGVSSVPGNPIGLNEFEGRGGDDIIISAVNGFGAALTLVSYVSATAGVTVDIAVGIADGDASVGHDTFVGSGILSVFGSAFADALRGSNNGFGTIEVFAGFAGNDTIDGRGGFDRADYNVDPTTTTGIVVHLAAGTVTGDATIGTDRLVSVEAVRGTNLADTYDATGFSGTSTNAGSFGTFNEFTGNGGDDNITGNGNTRISFTNANAGVTVDLAAGISFGTAPGDVASVGTDHFTGVNAGLGSMFADSFSGDANNNTFTGLGGNDFIDGRGGVDTASYNNIYQSTGGVSVDLARGIVTGDVSIGTDTLRSVEGIQGTNAADTFVATNFGIGAIDPSTGVAYANVGNIGDNNLFEGLGGDDTIIGNGHTQLLFGNATGGVTITLRDGSVPGGGGSARGDGSVGHDTFVGVNIVTGSAFGDIFDATGFTGTTSAGSFGNFNSFQGLGGDDTIIGNGNTSISFVNASGGVTVDLAGGIASGDTSVGHDSFVGVNNVFGSNFADTIFGSNNNDILTGNSGNDQFVFNASLHGTGHDLISDFNPGQDHIELDYTGPPGFDPNNAGSFNAWLGSHATTVTSDVLIDLNVDGASPGLDTILLKNVIISNLHASDFIVHP